jgi:hypothetical protein
MKKLTSLSLCLGCIFAVSTTHAIDLKQSKVTQVVNDVQIISAANQQQKAASVNDIFTMPDILSTGPASRAELVAADETVTRVGANTIFSFDPATRTINLKQGSLLFHSPHGKGGGTIHTGSATASVLGTTLIVTTTATGGMKVLDLEGQVEVKFLNGLKQNLEPGHMTFVLPGGNQLTPIIVFRLDNLTQNSQLVKGFNGSLASMPLIQQQIDKQIKLIQDGKLTDTGKEVAGEPNKDGGIPVIDLNTLQAALDQSMFNSATVNAALGKDVIINQSLVPSSHVFLDPLHPFILPGNTYYTGQPFVGFAAKNIYFNTIHTPVLTVDLSPQGLLPHVSAGEFDFVAAGNLTLAGSVDFQGLSLSEITLFSLVAGNQLTVAPGSTITANVLNFSWQTPQTLTLDGVSVNNGADAGSTEFATGGSFVMKNGASIQTTFSLSVQAVGDVSIDSSSLGAYSIFLNSAQGSVNISGTALQAQFLTVNSGADIILDGLGQSFNVANASFFAPGPNAIGTIQNSDLSNVAYLNMAANTITVSSTTFNPNNAYNFGTGTGNVNVNNGTTTGSLNLISDKLGNTAITSANQVNQTVGPSSNPGINSYAIAH